MKTTECDHVLLALLPVQAKGSSCSGEEDCREVQESEFVKSWCFFHELMHVCARLVLYTQYNGYQRLLTDYLYRFVAAIFRACESYAKVASDEEVHRAGN